MTRFLLTSVDIGYFAAKPLLWLSSDKSSTSDRSVHGSLIHIEPRLRLSLENMVDDSSASFAIVTHALYAVKLFLPYMRQFADVAITVNMTMLEKPFRPGPLNDDAAYR
jgi:hypothetical protein